MKRQSSTPDEADIPRLPTGIRNLDAVLGGGIPTRSVVVIGGPPGSGKTILAQQICFHNAASGTRVLYFNTLSEPAAKTLRYLQRFQFFDRAKLDESVIIVDLGIILRTKGLDDAFALVMDHLAKFKPSLVVIDSFKVFDDLAQSRGEVRKFAYEIAVNLMAWECTAFLLGEYGPQECETNPLFSIVDGMIVLSQRESSGEQQRYVHVAKMRGTAHSSDDHAFSITSRGIEVFAPRVTLRREPPGGAAAKDAARLKTGISKLDDLLGEGIPRGSSFLVAGVAGTGKTVLLLDFLYRGAQAGQKGIIFSFEETPERLRAAARGLGWDFDREIDRGMIEIVFIPQPEIAVESHLLMMSERIQRMKAERIAVDSLSVFLHKIRDPQVAREKTFQVASIVQNADGVGFFATDIPYGTRQISRFGVEETVIDGVIVLSAEEEGLERRRYIEIYKLRNTAHLAGRHPMAIEQGGIRIFPRYNAQGGAEAAPPPMEPGKRLASGVPGLDRLVRGGFLKRSVTLVSGSAGAGKSTMGLQFLLAGVKPREPGLFVALEEGPEQLLVAADALGLPLRAAVARGLVEIHYLPPERIRAPQFLAILTDRIRARHVRRLVLDSVSHIVPAGMAPEEVHEVLYHLAVRFKSLDVTSMLTLESPSLRAAESVTQRGFSPIADNILMLRYREADGGLRPSLTIVKTRGSPHDRGIHEVRVGAGGLRIVTPPREFIRGRGKRPRARR